MTLEIYLDGSGFGGLGSYEVNNLFVPLTKILRPELDVKPKNIR